MVASFVAFGLAAMLALRADLSDIFAEIGQEMWSQYVSSYIPANRLNGPGKIKVEMVNPDLGKAGGQLFYQQVIPK